MKKRILFSVATDEHSARRFRKALAFLCISNLFYLCYLFFICSQFCLCIDHCANRCPIGGYTPAAFSHNGNPANAARNRPSESAISLGTFA